MPASPLTISYVLLYVQQRLNISIRTCLFLRSILILLLQYLARSLLVWGDELLFPAPPSTTVDRGATDLAAQPSPRTADIQIATINIPLSHHHALGVSIPLSRKELQETSFFLTKELPLIRVQLSGNFKYQNTSCGVGCCPKARARVLTDGMGSTALFRAKKGRPTR